MQTFCTIITANYLPMAKVLFASIRKQEPNAALQVLVIDNDEHVSRGNLNIHTLSVLKEVEFFKGIEKKYAHTNKDYFRWALKPLFIGYLLEKGFSKVLYIDPDIYFVSDFSFLFNELDENNVLLTPHWASLDLIHEEDSVLAVLKGGIFNAGFVGANSYGLPAIQSWAAMCHYKTEDQKSIGLFVDQKYLDLIQVQFPLVKIIRHQGCNLAAWNIHSNIRELINGQLRINNQFEPVFIHFTNDTIKNIQNRNDYLLNPYLEEYLANLRNEKFNSHTLKELLQTNNSSTNFIAFKHKLSLRTRLKRFFYRIAEKL